MIPAGFEPTTRSLEGCRSIQLSYETSEVKYKSGQQDSNLRPPAPKAGAMTGLRYTPNGVLLQALKKRRDRDSNPGIGFPMTD